jgi:hypothetical protein
VKIRVLYECETWSLPLREEHRLRRIFGPKRDEVIGGWRKLHNEELHNLYRSSSTIRMIKSRRMRWAGHVTRMGEIRNVYWISVGKPEGKRPLLRTRRRWENNITRSSGTNQSHTFLGTTRATLKTTRPTILLLLRVYSLPR